MRGGGFFLMGNDDGRRWGRRNANASEASTTRSDFRMQAQAAASDCVTVETCRECGVPVPVLLNCLLCTPSARHNTPRCIAHVWRIRFPLSEATDDCGTGLWCQLSVDTKQPSFLLPPFYPPRQAILTTVTATYKLSMLIYHRLLQYQLPPARENPTSGHQRQKFWSKKGGLSRLTCLDDIRSK